MLTLPWVIALQLAVSAMPAATHVHRVALAIGANRGNASEQQLQYAVRDAQHLASVLVEIGGFDPNDVTVLSDPTPDEMRESFAKIHGKLAHDPRQTLFFVYYSGHADALAMHLGVATVSWEEMLHLTNKAGATTRLLLVDACRSGQVTRMKGSRIVTPFSIANAGPELPQGFAVLASASADEAAQESDDVGGSIFTQHFITALRGAGDINHDGRVSLTEAYEYSSDRTISSSANSMAGVQHATFRYHLRGHADLSLTNPGYSRSVTPLQLSAPGEYYLRFNDAAGALASAISVDDDRHTIWLPPGRYFVQRRTAASLYEGTIDLRAGATGHTNEAHLQARAMLAVAQKGNAAAADPAQGQVQALAAPGASSDVAAYNHALSLWGGTGSPLLGNFSLPWRLNVQYAYVLTQTWVLDAGAELGQSQVTNAQLTTRMTDVGLFVGARAKMSVGAFDLSAGLRVGGLLLQQAYTGTPHLDTAQSFAPFGAAVLRADWRITQRFFVGAEASLRAVPLSVNQATQWRAQPLINLGLGFKL